MKSLEWLLAFLKGNNHPIITHNKSSIAIRDHGETLFLCEDGTWYMEDNQKELDDD